jgi:hypothetical protein
VSVNLLQVIPNGGLVETESVCDVGLIHFAITFQKLFWLSDDEPDDCTLLRT